MHKHKFTFQWNSDGNLKKDDDWFVQYKTEKRIKIRTITKMKWIFLNEDSNHETCKVKQGSYIKSSHDHNVNSLTFIF